MTKSKIELTEFEGLKQAVKRFKITNFVEPSVPADSSKEFITQGLDIDLQNLFTANTGECMILLNKSIIKTVIYIVDISHWKEDRGYSPRVHIYECDKIQEMYKKKKKHRYKASGRTDGKFLLIKNNQESYKTLEICSYCLKLYNKKCNHNNTKQNFPLKEYMNTPIQHSHFVDMELDFCTVPNNYTSSWKRISHTVKKQAHWICSLCGGDFSSELCKKFLHTHHIDSNRKNNLRSNLKVLCIGCHSMQHHHQLIKQKQEYKEFLNSICYQKNYKNTG